MPLKSYSVLNNFISQAIYAIFGVLIITAALFVSYSYFFKQNIVDQYDAIAVWQNNSEGNWDIAYSIYRQNTDTWFHQQDQDIFYDGTANLIAKIPGDDQDPDIASTKSEAIAVWSNTGANGNNGADIYVAKWNNLGWEKPARLFNIEGDDTDPTIYMEAPGHALVVWLNNNNGVKNLYYSVYDNGQWGEPKQIPLNGISNIALPELGYVTLPYSRYLLTFEASTGSGNAFYTGIYNKVIDEWVIQPFDNPSTLVNSSVPAVGRTSSSMHVATHNFASAWTGSDGFIWAIKMNPSNMSSKPNPIKVGQGKNAVLMHDGNEDRGLETIVYSERNVLVSKTPIDGERVVVSNSENNFVRPDAVYMIERGPHPAVVVWRTEEGGEGEIYFSSLDVNSGKWQTPKKIDIKGFSGNDVNPAISPILIKITEEEKVVIEDEFPYVEEFCGDTIVQAPEECELGVACKTGQCDWDYFTKKYGKFIAAISANCECMLPPDEIPRTKSKPKSNEEIYAGAACGFDGLKILEKTGDNVNDEMKVAFLFEHGTQEETFSKNDDNTWSVVSSDGTMKLFPYAKSQNRPSAYATLTFLDENTIKMSAFDVGNPSFSYEMCNGVFEKGKKIEHQDLQAAPAPSENIEVPTLP